MSSELGNDAVGTVLVAALCDLQICKVPSCSQHTLAGNIGKKINALILFKVSAFPGFLYSLDNLAVGGSSKDCIHLRYFL